MELPVGDILDLLFGNFGLVVMLNFNCVEDFCRTKGVPLHIEHPSSGGLKLLIKAEPYSGEVGEGLWNRMMLEGLSLESFCGLIGGILEDKTILQ